MILFERMLIKKLKAAGYTLSHHPDNDLQWSVFLYSEWLGDSRTYSDALHAMKDHLEEQQQVAHFRRMWL